MATNNTDWLSDFNEDDMIEEEEQVFSGGSTRIAGYGSYDVKITMAKAIKIPKKKVEFIAIDFESSDGNTHTEEFMVRGSDGKPFFIVKAGKMKGKKRQHFGVSKIKSLLTVLGLYQDEKVSMAGLYGDTELADVDVWEKGSEKTKEFTVFTGLIGKKVTLCISTKKENGRIENDGEAYAKHCASETATFKKAHPKKKINQEPSDDWIMDYRSFNISEVKHFCQSTEAHLFGSEIESGESVLYGKFMAANEEGAIFDTRTLKIELLSEGEKAKFSLDDNGKVVEADDGESEGYDEPEESEESEDEWE